MRQSLIDLINKTIIYKYDLPNSGLGIVKTIYSTDADKCYSSNDRDDLTEIIYNSIIEYSFNEFDIKDKDFGNLHAIALMNKLKYNPKADKSVRIKYGFFGEVVLFSLLLVHFKANPLIARGYFYNPLESSETKGYDSYQLVDNGGQIELWFGEVKFHVDHKKGIKSVFDNISKAISDSYFESNIIAIQNQRNNLNIKGTVIETIIDSWEENPSIKIVDEVKKHNIKLVYPILLMYEDDETGYDDNIKKAIDHINLKHVGKSFNLSFDYSIFFILMPVIKVKDTKLNVLQWIESKRPPML